MENTKELIDSEKLARVIVEGMQEKKATDIVIIDLKGVKNAIADYFILCTGNSDTQIDAISNSVDEFVSKNANQNPWHKEGVQNKEWILLDYIDVVANIFRKDTRKFYSLEQLWGDAQIEYIDNVS